MGKKVTERMVRFASGEELIKGFMKRFYESALEGELEHHLGYPKGQKNNSPEGNLRNGFSSKSMITGSGKVDLDIPRDRTGEFEPEIIPKHSRRLPGFDDKVLYLYAQGLTQFP
jgi:transposase-like protein